MSLNHIKNKLAIFQRADITPVIVGESGMGKTSAVYQFYAEQAASRGQGLGKVSIKGRVGDGDDLVVDRDVSSLSTVNSRHLFKNVSESLDAFGLWTMSIIAHEEVTGMPYVVDDRAVYREVYLRACDVASRMHVNSDPRDMLSAAEDIFTGMCRKLGISEDDKHHAHVEYLRVSRNFPDHRHRGGGIWLIDELNRMEDPVRQALMQMILERRYLDYTVPEGVWIACTMNPDNGEYLVGQMDRAMMTRCAVVNAIPDIEEFIDWAGKSGVSETARIVADKHRKLIKYEADLRNEVKPTFRSLEMAGKCWDLMTKDEIQSVGMSVVSDLLGPDLGPIFFKEGTESVHRPLRIQEILNEYGWRQDMKVEELRDYKAWRPTKTRTRLHAMVKKTNVKTELLKITLDEAREYMHAFDEELKARGSDERTGSGLTDLEKGQMMNLLMFLRDLPVDISRRFLLEDMHQRFKRSLYWAGSMPIMKDLFERVHSQFEKEVENDKKRS